MASPEVLQKSNIILNQPKTSKEEAIKLCSALLVKNGYVTPHYLESVIKREKAMSTNIGNGLAFPHGEEQAKKEILHTGVVVITYPDGIEWGNSLVYMVIGVAAKDNEHIKLIGNIVDHLEEKEAVKKVVSTANADAIYNLLAGNPN